MMITGECLAALETGFWPARASAAPALARLERALEHSNQTASLAASLRRLSSSLAHSLAKAVVRPWYSSRIEVVRMSDGLGHGAIGPLQSRTDQSTELGQLTASHVARKQPPAKLVLQVC